MKWRLLKRTLKLCCDADHVESNRSDGSGRWLSQFLGMSNNKGADLIECSDKCAHPIKYEAAATSQRHKAKPSDPA